MALNNIATLLAQLGLTSIIVLVPLTTIIYAVALTIYRLWFCPLAKFPGPKLTAVTGWYETYYQLYKGEGGQFIFKIEEWHRQYGPIVRISPTELHISDPEFYETIYSLGSDIDKPSYMKWQFGTPGTMFAAINAQLHRARRSSLNPFFSKRKIVELEPRIKLQIDKMCQRLEMEYSGMDKVLRFDHMIASVTIDIVTNYAFGKSYNFVEAPDFVSPFTSMAESFKKAAQLSVQFPWLPRLFASLPESWVAAINPIVIPSLQFRRAMVQQIKEIQISHRAGEKGDSKDTMFTNILDSDLAPSEKTTERLADEAAGVVGAALETTKWAVSVIMVYVLSHATILKELKRELRDANAGDMSITELEKLPYLTAVIEEGLRNSYGAVSRSPRIHRNRPLQYAAYTIPPGTPVSASTYIMHHNEDVFPSSRDFDPSRFLDNARGPDRSKPLSRYVTAFTKGTRMCLGMQLAYAEIELLLAALFTRFEFSLFETTVKDVTITSDQAGVGVWKGSKGIRVTLTKLSA